MRTRTLAATLLSLLLALPALVEAAKVRSGYDQTSDLAPIKTWRFRSEQGPAPAAVDGRVRAEVRSALAAKGLREVAAGETADVLLAYKVERGDRLFAELRVGIGWFGDILPLLMARSEIAAGLLLEMDEGKSGRPVWAGCWTLEGEPSRAVEEARERAADAVRAVLKKFPPKPVR